MDRTRVSISSRAFVVGIGCTGAAFGIRHSRKEEHSWKPPHPPSRTRGAGGRSPSSARRTSWSSWTSRSSTSRCRRSSRTSTSRPGDLQWVLSAYALTFGGFLLLGGRIGGHSRPPAGVHGRRRPVHARVARLRALELGGDADRGPGGAGPRRGDPLPRRRSRSSRRRSTRAPSGTRRSGSGARWAAAAPPSACSPAAS